MVNPTTIRLAWKPPKDTTQCGDKYLVIVQNATYKKDFTVTKPEFILSNINPSASYTFNVHATDKQGKPFRASTSLTVRVSKTELTTVKDLTAKTLNRNTIKLTWTKGTPVEQFKDEYHITIYGEGFKKTYTTKETLLIAGGFDISKIDKVTVQSVWKNGTMFPAVATVSVKRAIDDPVPSAKTASMLNPTTIRVAWKPPKDTSKCGDKYLVIVQNATYKKDFTVAKPEYILSNINLSSSYVFTIHATDKQGKPFKSSTSLTLKLSKTEYTTVKDLTATNVNRTAIKLTWTKGTPADKFKDEYHITIFGQGFKKTYTTQETSFVAGGLDISKLDKVTVQSVLKNGEMFPAVATISVKRPIEEPVPAGRTASMLNPTTIRVAWKPPKDPSECGDKYLVIVQNATYKKDFTVAKPEFRLSNINPSSSYTFNIHATDKQGKPFKSSSSLTIKLSKTEYTTVRDLKASQASGNAIKVSWSKPVPADKFKDEYHVTVYGQGFKKTYTTKDTSVVAGGLDLSKLDKITVQNVWKNGTIFPAVATISVKKGKCYFIGT
ncbi:unnamed protein product [Dibothriocephalus latus]|uniref:Fibronectin type-III domain-containing protein n=1 Tax=Dibothriocephalus latus TaxID=60516 RepID=A0A3P7KWZ0_DIBLA|nr:unnamed protein product [Dibothriocephalus latus]